MGLRKELSQVEYDYLVDAVDKGNSYYSMADAIGVCVDTLKRILHRNDIVQFEGAKFQTRSGYEMWDRPCMRCKSQELRPKFQYICDKCADDPDVAGLANDWLLE